MYHIALHAGASYNSAVTSRDHSRVCQLTPEAVYIGNDTVDAGTRTLMTHKFLSATMTCS
jgi:hypothetical protein